MATQPTPYISCIITAFNEGRLAQVSIDSMLAQSFKDFELLVVDDGADDATRNTLLHYDDPRIVHIRQANDGLSSARNRALDRARGTYVCFLDADDTRPAWALATMVQTAIAANNPDCVLSPGVLQEVRSTADPFYDQSHFNALSGEGMSALIASDDPHRFELALRHIACMEPQSANKMVRRDFLQAHKLRFPAGLFFEDMLFHLGILINMESYALTTLPTFTYFRRYGRPQVTGTASQTRFDAISVATNALFLFSESRYYRNPVLRALVFGAIMKLVKWCGESVSHEYKYAYDLGVSALLANLDPRYINTLQIADDWEVRRHASWITPSFAYVRQMM